VLEYLLTLLVTAAVTYLLTPLVRRGAIAARAMKAPRKRDVHTVPMPLWGGLAMFAGLAAGLLVADHLTPLRTVLVGNRIAAGLLLAGGLIVVVGVVDDRWGLGPISKLAGQAAAGGILFWSGCQLSWLPEPGGGTFLLTTNQSTVLTVFLVVATINAVNFIDGLDGLAAGIVCIAAIAFFVYYYRLTQVVHPHLSEQAGPALVSALLVGACLGFLPHNSHPAKIFMGDTGSMLLGLLLAYVPISSINSLDPGSLHSAANRFPEILPLLLPATILVIPYADLLLAVTRRVRAGKSPLAPDRKHLHHRLQDMGHPHRTSVLILYLWAALFSAAIVWLSIARTPVFVFAVTTFVAIVALLFMSMPRLRWWQRGQRRARAAAASVAAQSISTPRPEPVGSGSARPAAGSGSARPAAGNGTPRPAPAGPARPVRSPAMPAPMLPAPTLAPPAAPPAPVPPASVPPATVPQASVPPATVPQASVPPASVPPATAPQAMLPPPLPQPTLPAGDGRQPGQAAVVGGPARYQDSGPRHAADPASRAG
jgi:UDP-GlcNAc:undecaprenyl-phosphate/decaprenyl-phosphate GlcNAc-1-phosphate transferase